MISKVLNNKTKTGENSRMKLLQDKNIVHGLCALVEGPVMFSCFERLGLDMAACHLWARSTFKTTPVLAGESAGSEVVAITFTGL